MLLVKEKENYQVGIILGNKIFHSKWMYDTLIIQMGHAKPNNTKWW